MNNISVKVNPAYLPYMEKPQFLQIFYGGSSSGKSYFLAQKIVMDTLNGCNWLCCRNVARTIRNSIFNEIKKAIYTMGVQKLFKTNKSDMVMTCSNGRQILFAGLDDPEKVKSITPAEGVLERIFVEEATEVTEDAYRQLTKRLRGMSRVSKHIILAFNPILKSHWIYREFFGQWEDGKTVYEDSRKLIVKTTYKDNLFLTADDRKLLEDESDPYYYNVYSLGNWGVLGHVIFKNWHVESLGELIPKFDRIYCGMDFGYSSDPNALIKVCMDKKNKRIFVFDEYYKAGMLDDELVQVGRRFFGKEIVTCDCADAKTIDLLCTEGLNAVPAVKGANSINRGIRYLQGFEIIIDVHCQNFKNEIEQYHWLEDKYGNAMAKPCDKDNHLIDALRYAVESEMLQSELTAGIRL